MNIIESPEGLETLRWHKLIEPACGDILKLSINLTIAELYELFEAAESDENKGAIVKEATDVIVTEIGCWMHSKGDISRNLSLILIKAMCELLESMGVDPRKALAAVNESNFSKLILDSEAEAASDHFAHAGIEVYIKSLGDGLMGCYSSRVQTVKGKFYEADKLLKSHKYMAIDESKRFWL